MSTEQNRTGLYSNRICFHASEALSAEIEAAASERELSAAAWIRQAIKAYLRTASKNRKQYRSEIGTWNSGYPRNAKCFYCKTACHDPSEHHLLEVIQPEDIEWGKAHPCEETQ